MLDPELLCHLALGLAIASELPRRGPLALLERCGGAFGRSGGLLSLLRLLLHVAAPVMHLLYVSLKVTLLQAECDLARGSGCHARGLAWVCGMEL